MSSSTDIQASSDDEDVEHRWLTLTRWDFDVVLTKLKTSLESGQGRNDAVFPAVKVVRSSNTANCRTLCSSPSRRALVGLEGFFGPTSSEPRPYDYSVDMAESQREHCVFEVQGHIQTVQISEASWSEFLKAKAANPQAETFISVAKRDTQIEPLTESEFFMDSVWGPIVTLPCVKSHFGKWHFKGFFRNHQDWSLNVRRQSIQVTADPGSSVQPLKVGLRFQEYRVQRSERD